MGFHLQILFDGNNLTMLSDFVVRPNNLSIKWGFIWHKTTVCHSPNWILSSSNKNKPSPFFPEDHCPDYLLPRLSPVTGIQEHSLRRWQSMAITVFWSHPMRQPATLLPQCSVIFFRWNDNKVPLINGQLPDRIRYDWYELLWINNHI